MDHLLSLPEVALVLGISRSKLYEVMATGLLPTVKVGRSRRVRPADLEAFIEAHVSVEPRTSSHSHG